MTKDQSKAKNTQLRDDVIIGVLIGCVIILSSGTFKGQLAEPEYLVDYIFQIVAAAAGCVLIIRHDRKSRKKTPDSVEQTYSRSKFFYPIVVVVPFVLIALIVMKFPNGEGLFHATRAENVDATAKRCRERHIANVFNQTATEAAFCQCWADALMTTIEKGQEINPVVGQKIGESCRQ